MICASFEQHAPAPSFRTLGQVGEQILAQALGGRRERRQFAVPRQLQVPAPGRGRGNRKAHVAEQRPQAAPGMPRHRRRTNPDCPRPSAARRPGRVARKPGRHAAMHSATASPASDSRVIAAIGHPRGSKSKWRRSCARSPAAESSGRSARPSAVATGEEIAWPENRRRSGNSRISWLAALGKAQPT